MYHSQVYVELRTTPKNNAGKRGETTARRTLWELWGERVQGPLMSRTGWGFIIKLLVKHDPLHVEKKADVATLSSAGLLVHVLSWGPCFDEHRNMTRPDGGGL